MMMKEIIFKEHIEELKEYIEAADKLGLIYYIEKKNISGADEPIYVLYFYLDMDIGGE